MLPVPRRALRSVVTYILSPVILLTLIFSYFSPSSSSSSSSSSPYNPILNNPTAEAGSQVAWNAQRNFKNSQNDANRPHNPYYPSDADSSSSSSSLESNSDSPSSSSSSFPQHTFLTNGLVLPNPNGRHPIYDLIERGKREWKEKHERQSQTLGEAVKEYRRRYHRNPPRGFDKWWDYVTTHNVPLVDEYDKINRDLLPFHGMTPSYLLSLQKTWESIPGTYVLECNPNPSSSHKSKFLSERSPNPKPKGCHLAHTTFLGNDEELNVGLERAEAQLGLLREVEEDLEGLGELRVTFYAHDGPFQMVGHDYLSSLVDAASVEEHINPHEHEHDLHHRGWASACAPHETIYDDYDPDVLLNQQDFWDMKKSFIWDHAASMDPCKHPQLTQNVGFLAAYGKGPVPEKDVYPVLSMCSTKLHADVTAISMEAFVEDVKGDVPWEEKTGETLLWRGSTTGIMFEEKLNWNASQRARLVKQVNAESGVVPLLSPLAEDSAVGSAEDVMVKRLNDRFFDIGFASDPIQCTPKVCKELSDTYEFKSRQPFDVAYKHKYLYDIDGNGFSARYKRLITTRSMILKTTIFPEWYQDRIQPWVHYVPVKSDITDLYDIMAFFRGTEDDGSDGHDAMAKEIADAGREWSLTYWRKEDLVAYQFRMFLELARLMARNRSKMDFVLPTSSNDLNDRIEEEY